MVQGKAGEEEGEAETGRKSGRVTKKGLLAPS